MLEGWGYNAGGGGYNAGGGVIMLEGWGYNVGVYNIIWV